MTKIEIYERSTGEVIETKEVNNMKSFLFYWSMQCDGTAFGWRTVKESEV